MFLHIGNDIAITMDHVIGIFDMDNTTVSKLGREFLSHAQTRGSIVNATEELPKSYIVTMAEGKEVVYVSSISTQVLWKRAYATKKELYGI